MNLYCFICSSYAHDDYGGQWLANSKAHFSGIFHEWV